MTALVHFKGIHQVEILTLHNFNTAPSSSTASWHGLYKPLDPKVKLQSLLLFSNTLYSNNKSS